MKRKHNTLLILFLLIPFFRPDFIGELCKGTMIDQIFSVWRILSFLIIILLNYKSKLKIDFPLCLIISYEAISIISAYMNQVSPAARMVSAANFIGIVLMFRYFSKYMPKIFIVTTFGYCTFLTLVNAMLTVIYPHGLNHAAYDSGRINFMGKDNTITLFFLVVIVFCVLYSNSKSVSKLPFYIYLCIVATSIYYFSGSGMIAISIIVGYVMFLSYAKFPKWLCNCYTVVGVIIVLELILVKFQNTEQFSFIFNLLGKDSTFTDRTYYWMQALKQIEASPLIGTGDGVVRLWNAGNYAHNAMLDIILKTGYLGLINWILIIVSIFRKHKDSGNWVIKNFMLVVLFSYLCIGLVEGLEDRIMFNAFLALALSINDIENSGLLNKRLFNITRVKFVLGGSNAH